MASGPVIPVLARRCLDRVKVLPGVEIHGDRRAYLEDALGNLLTLWFTESDDIRKAARREARQAGVRVPFRDRLRLLVRRRMKLTGPWREIPKTELQTFLDAIHDADVREVVEELIGEPPRRDPEPPILVHLCLDLLRSGDFAEIAATDEELVRELQTALADAPRTLDDLIEPHPHKPDLHPHIPLPGEALLEERVRRLLEWLRGGSGPPADGPGGGSCPPPAVPA